MQCPRCGLSYPNTERRCDCGYRFTSQPQVAGAETFRLFGTTFQGDRIVQSPASENAKRHLTRSLAIAGIVPVLLVPFLWDGMAVVRTLLLLGVSAYGAWATYWGSLGVGNFLTDHAGNRAGKVATHFTVHHLNIYVLLVPILLGAVYGTLGGGPYEFLKQRRIVNNPGLLSGWSGPEQ